MKTISLKLTALAMVFFAASAEAGNVHLFAGRYYFDGHPYHNGYPFVPPSSAYEAVGLRPPFWYGVPAYYIPQSYMAPGNSYYPPAWYPGYPSVSTWRNAGYYMSAHAGAYSYPW